MKSSPLRQKLGCILLDLPRILPALLNEEHWIYAQNRDEHLAKTAHGVDTSPMGRWSRDLHCARVFPWIGNRLMKQAFKQWPMDLQHHPPKKPHSKPAVSFVIPFRGEARLPLLQATLRSILNQQGVAVECLVVEQDKANHEADMPQGVRYHNLPHPTNPEGWHKSWAFNEGVKQARADIVVCHDADIPVPARYAREIVRHLDSTKYEVCHLQRFLFCLGPEDTRQTLQSGRPPAKAQPERIRQNWQGGTVAIRKEAFGELGGYDESYVNWGGEDNEFYDRCQTLNVYKFGYLPFIHLWHPPQASKHNTQRPANLEQLDRALSIPAEERIRRLVQPAHANSPTP